ncbi:MAG: response regulator [Nitrospirales bacterium]
MQSQPHMMIVLMAEDDADDRLMVEEAWHEVQSPHGLRFVENGEELLDYLYHRGAYVDSQNSPRPSLILIDLNMPKVNGWQALKFIKTDPELKQIPVVVVSTSGEYDDVVQAYDLGVNGYITKSLTFDGVVQTMKALNDYWLSITTLPSQNQR